MKPLNENFTFSTCETYTSLIYMAGDISTAKNYLAKRAANEGNCWSVEPTEFIYSGGREHGFVIRYINYPRIPWGKEKIKDAASKLALELIHELGQGSCSIVFTDETIYISRRKE